MQHRLVEIYEAHRSMRAVVYQAHYSMRAWASDCLTVDQFIELVNHALQSDDLSEGDRATLQGLAQYWQHREVQRVLNAEHERQDGGPLRDTSRMSMQPSESNAPWEIKPWWEIEPPGSVPSTQQPESDGEWWWEIKPPAGRKGKNGEQPPKREVTRAAALELEP